MVLNPPANIELSPPSGERANLAKYATALAKPKSIEDIQALLRWANIESLTLVPVSSTGSGRFEAKITSELEQTIIVDLSEMNSFKHIDARDKIAIIEPGVSFGQVDELLKPQGLRAFRPLKPRAGKSVLASYLDREPLINPFDHWDVADPIGGTCVVLGSGDMQLTGTAAVEGSLEEQLAKGHRHMVAPGPVAIDLLRVIQGSQGSLGIMAWGAVYCEPIPQVERSFFVSADDLQSALNLARDLLHRRNGSALFIADKVQLAMLMATNGDDWLSKIEALPEWSVFVTLSGATHRPEQKVAWQIKALETCAQQHGVQLSEALGEVLANDFARSLRETQATDFRDQISGAHKNLFFLQTFSQLSKVDSAVKQCAQGADFSKFSIGTYIQPVMQGTQCHVEYTLPYSVADDEASAQLDNFWAELARCANEQGAFFSRPYGEWSKLAFEGKQSSQYMLSATKQLLDPNGVMNANHIEYAGDLS